VPFVQPIIRYATLAVMSLLFSSALAQGDAASTFGLEPGEHAVGFRLLEDDDRSRAVTGGSRSAVHPRPMRTYLWYPAQASRRSQPLRFGRYAALADEDVWPSEIAGELRERLKYSNGPLARSLPAEGFAALLERPMRAVENAEPVAGPFPLIVIGLGLYYESPVTFSATAEYLAGRGFVVATAPLVGTHTALVRLNVPDLETQIRDLEFVTARARQYPFVDPERLGVLGFDQGGMAGVVLAMRNRDVDAFVSLDSGIQYPHESGLPRTSPHYDVRALRVPWLHAAVQRNEQAPGGNATSLYDEAVHADRYWLRVEGLGHADFTSYALVEGRGEAAGYWGPVTPTRAAGHRAIVEYVRHFFATHLAASDVGSALFDQALRQPLPEAGMTLEHRAAAPEPISYDEVVRKIVSGQGDQAIAELRLLASSEPEHAMLTEFSLGRLCVSLLYTWNLPEQTLPLVEFGAELYPSSPAGQVMLGETYATLGNNPAAIAAYEEALKLLPGNPQITALIERLRSQR
jgi:dienelactone hydrolase